MQYINKAGETKRRFLRFGEPGLADLVCYPVPADNRGYTTVADDPNGKRPLVLWVETKAPGGRQSESQKAFEKYVTERGMNYLVAWDAQDVWDWLKSRGVK